MTRPRFRPAQYTEIATRLDELSRRAELGERMRVHASQQNAHECLVDAIQAGGPDGLHVVTSLPVLRDIARYAGARKVGKTRDEAVQALVSAWLTFRRLGRDGMRGGSQSEAWRRWQAARLARRAYAHGRTPREQAAHELRQQEAIELTGRICQDLRVGRAIIAAFAARHGRAWFGTEVAMTA